jgi:hypothetical protein
VFDISKVCRLSETLTIALDENSGGKPKPKKNRSKFSKLAELGEKVNAVNAGLSPPPRFRLPIPKFTVSDYEDYELSGQTSQTSCNPTQ